MSEYTVVKVYNSIVKMLNPEGNTVIEMASLSDNRLDNAYHALSLSAFILNNERKGVPITQEMIQEFMSGMLAESEGE